MAVPVRTAQRPDLDDLPMQSDTRHRAQRRVEFGFQPRGHPVADQVQSVDIAFREWIERPGLEITCLRCCCPGRGGAHGKCDDDTAYARKTAGMRDALPREFPPGPGTPLRPCSGPRPRLAAAPAGR